MATPRRQSRVTAATCLPDIDFDTPGVAHAPPLQRRRGAHVHSRRVRLGTRIDTQPPEYRIHMHKIADMPHHLRRAMVCQGPLVYIGKSDLTMGGLSYGSEPIKKARPPLAAPSPQRQNKGAPTPSRTPAALRAQQHSHTCDLTDHFRLGKCAPPPTVRRSSARPEVNRRAPRRSKHTSHCSRATPPRGACAHDSCTNKALAAVLYKRGRICTVHPTA